MLLPALLEDSQHRTPRLLAARILAAPPVGLEEVAAFLGAPTHELNASAISARVAVAGANAGHAFVHHEHRLAPLLPPEAAPEIDVGHDLGVPEDWVDGELRVPKYFSAFLEAPLPTFDPNHRGKWRPHELLHRLAGFAWRPDLTRFEAYLTARLSELLPVVHWYGFDEIGRYACPEHMGTVPGRSTCRACLHGTCPYWEVSRDENVAQAMSARALEHLQTELDACARELQTGRIVDTPRPDLNASSDAVGYLRAHWNRITSWSFGAWVERFPSDVHFKDCTDHLAHVQGLADRLLHASWTLDPAPQRERARAKRRAADLGYRILLHIETLDSDAAEDELLPHVDALAQSNGASIDAVIEELGATLRRVDAGAADRTMAGGWTWCPPSHGTALSLATGLRTALPRSLADVDDDTLTRWAADFAAQDSPSARDLGSRFATFAASNLPDIAATTAFESWLRAAPALDLEAERFGAVPERDDAAGRVQLNATLRKNRFDTHAVSLVLGDDDTNDEGVQTRVAIRWAGEPRVIDCTPDIERALDTAKNGVLALDEATETLIERGFVVWLPDPR